jgi:hypothetical protein
MNKKTFFRPVSVLLIAVLILSLILPFVSGADDQPESESESSLTVEEAKQGTESAATELTHEYKVWFNAMRWPVNESMANRPVDKWDIYYDEEEGVIFILCF